VTRPAPATNIHGHVNTHPLEQLTPQERAVYEALEQTPGRVVSRAELARRAGIADLSARRCDSLIVGIRRRIGPGRVQTVRQRGWMLVPGPS
jgi:uroporphyrinogen-III synthase